MFTIGLISDTHSFLDPRVAQYFANVDEIWHAGDIGDIEVLYQLKEQKPVQAVYGNIDDANVRRITEEHLIQEREGLRIYMTHIAGNPPRYNGKVRENITGHKPQLLICGHSHLLKVMPDRENQLLYMNPGAAGRHGFHRMRTLIRFSIEQGKIIKPEVIELGLRGKIQQQPPPS
jgi:hypothetical protein